LARSSRLAAHSLADRLWPALLLLVFCGCAPRVYPDAVDLPRADRTAPSRVVRVLAGPGGATEIQLARASGRFLLQRTRTALGQRRTITAQLLSDDGERLHLSLDPPQGLVDFPAAHPFPFAVGETLTLRFATGGTAPAAALLLALTDDGGHLRLLVVRRPPDATPWPTELALPGGLTVTPGDEPVYLESFRLPSYCVAEIAHRMARVTTAAHDDGSQGAAARLAPGEGTRIETPAGPYLLLLTEHERPVGAPCADPPPSVLSYWLVSLAEGVEP
jgi:hypothetical protein